VKQASPGQFCRGVLWRPGASPLSETAGTAGLEVPPDGVVLEVGGQPVARVTPVRNGVKRDHLHGGPWTEAKATRRCELVDREIDGTLTPDEAVELEVLQQQMLQERQRLAPVPLDELRRLHPELLAKAQRQAGQDGP
jgi:hypothetical protein